MGSRLTLRAPGDYLFRRDVCSYGYFLLAPNRWDPRARTLTRPLDLPGGIATFTLAQPGEKRGAPVVALADRTLSRADRSAATGQLTRMLRLDDDGVSGFHRVDPRWRRSGRARLFRSPTLFEDILKTVTSCNVTWPSTVSMYRRLCEAIHPAFPSAEQLARRRPATLRARCGVGYRDKRIVDLSRLARDGALADLENPARPDGEVYESLLELPGIGPYAASNILQLLGRYSRVPVDTETLRHGRTTLGFKGSEAAIRRRVEAHYAPFGEHRFRSFWFEMWKDYEGKRGPAWTWDPHEVGAYFTASRL